jgi:hypothetical protein
VFFVHQFRKYFFSIIPSHLQTNLPIKSSFSPSRVLAFKPKARIFMSAKLAFYAAAERRQHVGQGSYYSQKKQKAA